MKREKEGVTNKYCIGYCIQEMDSHLADSELSMKNLLSGTSTISNISKIINFGWVNLLRRETTMHNCKYTHTHTHTPQFLRQWKDKLSQPAAAVPSEYYIACPWTYHTDSWQDSMFPCAACTPHTPERVGSAWLILLVHSWGWTWADYMYIVTIATCSASGVSALLVCTALHPQMTCRHCIKLSVAPMSIKTAVW